MENDAFYNPNPIPREFDEHRAPGSAGWRHRDQSQTHPRDDLDIESNAYDGRRFAPAQTFDYDHMVDRDARWKDEQVDDVARWRERQSATGTARSRFEEYDKLSSKYRDSRDSDDPDRKLRLKGYGQGAEDPSAASGRRNYRSKSRDRDRDRDADRRDRDRCRDRERRNRRDESGYGNERDDSEYRPRRRSRSRDRDRSERDRRYRDSDRDRDRRHRDFDRGDTTRPRRNHDRDRGERETSPKEVPWVPPPLPAHLRHLQVQWALTPVASDQQQASSSSSATQPLPPPIQNQFQNDGSFMEMFRQRMQQGAAPAALDDSKASAGTSTSASVVATAPVEGFKPPAAAGPSLAANSSGLPVIAKRRISKILKTGIVQKKKKEEEEEEEDKGGDGWSSSYMKEVQKYRANKCIENEASRPPLVK